jgi:cytoskeletal protein RodZ
MSESLGKTLRKIREAKNLSLEEVSEKTRTPKKIISSIEEDRLHEIASLFYAKNFVKSYAQFLVALEEKTVKEYLSTCQKKDTPQVALKREKPKGDWFIRHKKHIGVVVLTVFGIYVLIFGFFQMKKFVRNAYVKHKIHAVERQKQQKLKAAEKQKNKETPAKQVLLGPVEKKSNLIVTDKKEKEFELKIEVRYNTWVQVMGDGALLFRGALEKGTSDIWKAKKEITLELGNAGGVILSIDGKNLGPPGKKGEKKTVIVTKDGIK